jgi:Amidohydrolase family
MHTIHGAFASFEEGFKSSLEVGKAADLVVLAEDLSRVPVEHIRDVGVFMTVVSGEVAYEAGGCVPVRDRTRSTLGTQHLCHRQIESRTTD